MKAASGEARSIKYRKPKKVRKSAAKRARTDHEGLATVFGTEDTEGSPTELDEDGNNDPILLRTENQTLKEKVAEQQEKIKSLEGRVKNLKERLSKYEPVEESALDANSKASSSTSQPAKNSDKNVEHGQSSKNKIGNCQVVERPQPVMETTLVALNISSFEETRNVLSNQFGANQHLSLVITAKKPLSKGVDSQMENVTSAITDNLKLHGTSVLKFECGTQNVNFTSYFQSDRHWYQVLITWLTLMPNLEEISVYSYNYGRQKPKDLASLANSQEFPYFQNLRHLTASELPSSVLRAVLIANPHIDILKCIRPSSRLDDVDAFENLQLFNLIALTYHDINSKTQNLDALEDLDASLLKTLVLGNLENNAVSQNFSAIISKFQATLQTLHLGVILPTTSLLEFPSLPGLKELKFELKYDIAIKNPQRIFDLLQPLQSLERLEIRQLETPSIVAMDKSSRKNLLNMLFICILWKLLPKLGIVKMYDIQARAGSCKEFVFTRR